MGVEDREALMTLRAAIDPEHGGDQVIRRFYTRWFASDISARDLFPPDPEAQRAAFGQALMWILTEFIDQRAELVVAFLAQLGRDHRKYGVTHQHYASVQEALLTTLRSHLGELWDERVAEATTHAVDLVVGIMRGSADTEDGPPYREGTVLQHLRVTREVSVVRLRLDEPLLYHAGQYVSVQIPQWPRRWRLLSPSMPSEANGAIEFHVRSVGGGMLSTTIVNETRPGDRWRVSNPHGGMHIQRDDGDVLMIAGSTGLAPLRAMIMDLCQQAINPRVHLFFGGRYPCDLYDLRTLWEIAATNPWLSVTPVSEYAADPAWAADYPDVQPPRGLHVRQTGKLADVVTRYGNWGDRQILICGGPQMIETTKAALLAKGAPPERIQHDPLTR